jgi:hypothetical protein
MALPAGVAGLGFRQALSDDEAVAVWGQRARKVALRDHAEEIARLDAQIARLEGMREGLLQAKALIQGQGRPATEPAAERRKRSRNIKPLIIDTMMAAAYDGATSADVSAIVWEKVPSVAKYTVGCTLSRLKADGALAFDGERYYESRLPRKTNDAPLSRNW